MYLIKDLNSEARYLVECSGNNSNIHTVTTEIKGEALKLPSVVAETIACLYNRAFPDRNFGIILESEVRETITPAQILKEWKETNKYLPSSMPKSLLTLAQEHGHNFYNTDHMMNWMLSLSQAKLVAFYDEIIELRRNATYSPS
jgi:hypothetical protein